MDLYDFAHFSPRILPTPLSNWSILRQFLLAKTSNTPVHLQKNFRKASLVFITGAFLLKRSFPLSCFLSLFTLDIFLVGIICFFFELLLTHFSPCSSHLITNHCIQLVRRNERCCPSAHKVFPSAHFCTGSYLQMNAERKEKKKVSPIGNQALILI